MKRLFFPLRIYAGLALVFLCLTAFKIPPAPNGYIYDEANLLNSSTKAQLENYLLKFEEQTSNQVVVATFPSLEDESLEDITMRIAEAWKPGQKGRDNGVFLFIFQKERQLRIEVGYGLEGALTDALSRSIIEQEIIPYFKQGNFDQGILSGVGAIVKATQGEYKGIQKNRSSGKKSPLSSLIPLILILLLASSKFFWPALFGMSLGSRHHRGGGFGGFGGGGFGGFGGGGFGGGGASGRW